MKKLVLIVACSLTISALAEDTCKNLKACADWATAKTGIKYELGKLEKRGLKIEKDLVLEEGDADLLFNFILQSNELLRLKRENGTYQVINAREMKDFQFPTVKAEEIPATLDYFMVEFSLSNKDRARNARVLLKKFLGKNGRMLEVADAPKLQIVETGIQLNAIRSMLTELNK